MISDDVFNQSFALMAAKCPAFGNVTVTFSVCSGRVKSMAILPFEEIFFTGEKSTVSCEVQVFTESLKLRMLKDINNLRLQHGVIVVSINVKYGELNQYSVYAVPEIDGALLHQQIKGQRFKVAVA